MLQVVKRDALADGEFPVMHSLFISGTKGEILKINNIINNIFIILAKKNQTKYFIEKF